MAPAACYMIVLGHFAIVPLLALDIVVGSHPMTAGNMKVAPVLEGDQDTVADPQSFVVVGYL
jgi:hypothetical protein